jgi:DNA replication regulator DPB11
LCAVSFRTHLQEKISANGGEYRGDLTKEVTHLIAYAAEGKKYQYATQWEVKIVGLKWLNDSLDRRMILNEALYHPTIPSDKQGAGAWNRQTTANVQLGKRSRHEEAVADVPRKLRRTASAKLGSQSETLWSEIVNGPPMDDSTKNNHLRSSKSSSALRPVVLEPKSFATDSTGLGDDGRKFITKDSKTADHQQIRKGIFSGFGFFLYAFNSKQVKQAGHFSSTRGFTNKILRCPFYESTYSAMTERSTSPSCRSITMRHPTSPDSF